MENLARLGIAPKGLLSNFEGAHRERGITPHLITVAKFREVDLIFRLRVPKPYFPDPGPFKTGRGRVSLHLGYLCIDLQAEMGKTIVHSIESKHV